MDTRLTPARKEKDLEIREQIDALRLMTVGQLRERYRELFGEESRSSNKQFLFRRIAWRIQALAEGGLSDRARRRALEIANDADLRVTAPRNYNGKAAARAVTRRVVATDPRLPPPGQSLSRVWQGQTVVVRIRPEAFEYNGRFYKSLSAIAREVTGTKWNGYLFFNIAGNKAENAQS
jgi:hypothetical protein